MLNREKYANEIIDIACGGNGLAIVKETYDCFWKIVKVVQANY